MKQVSRTFLGIDQNGNGVWKTEVITKDGITTTYENIKQNETPELKTGEIGHLYGVRFVASEEVKPNEIKVLGKLKPQDNIELKKEIRQEVSDTVMDWLSEDKRFFGKKLESITKPVERFIDELTNNFLPHLKDDNKIRREEIEKAYTDGAEDFAYYLDSPEVNGELDDKAQRRFYYWAYIFQKPKEYLKKEEHDTN